MEEVAFESGLECLVEFGWVDICGVEWSDSRIAASTDCEAAKEWCLWGEGQAGTLEWSLTWRGEGAAGDGAQKVTLSPHS